jgi:hypothetical protein
MDEAHVLKDKGSFRWKNLMAVAQHARQRLMLTGTPLQNDLHVSIATSVQLWFKFVLQHAVVPLQLHIDECKIACYHRW